MYGKVCRGGVKGESGAGREIEIEMVVGTSVSTTIVSQFLLLIKSVATD